MSIQSFLQSLNQADSAAQFTILQNISRQKIKQNQIGRFGGLAISQVPVPFHTTLANLFKAFSTSSKQISNGLIQATEARGAHQEVVSSMARARSDSPDLGTPHEPVTEEADAFAPLTPTSISSDFAQDVMSQLSRLHSEPLEIDSEYTLASSPDREDLYMGMDPLEVVTEHFGHRDMVEKMFLDKMAKDEPYLLAGYGNLAKAGHTEESLWLAVNEGLTGGNRIPKSQWFSYDIRTRLGILESRGILVQDRVWGFKAEKKAYTPLSVMHTKIRFNPNPSKADKDSLLTRQELRDFQSREVKQRIEDNRHKDAVRLGVELAKELVETSFPEEFLDERTGGRGDVRQRFYQEFANQGLKPSQFMEALDELDRVKTGDIFYHYYTEAPINTLIQFKAMGGTFEKFLDIVELSRTQWHELDMDAKLEILKADDYLLEYVYGESKQMPVEEVASAEAIDWDAFHLHDAQVMDATAYQRLGDALVRRADMLNDTRISLESGTAPFTVEGLSEGEVSRDLSLILDEKMLLQLKKAYPQFNLDSSKGARQLRDILLKIDRQGDHYHSRYERGPLVEDYNRDFDITDGDGYSPMEEAVAQANAHAKKRRDESS